MTERKEVNARRWQMHAWRAVPQRGSMGAPPQESSTASPQAPQKPSAHQAGSSAAPGQVPARLPVAWRSPEQARQCRQLLRCLQRVHPPHQDQANLPWARQGQRQGRQPAPSSQRLGQLLNLQEPTIVTAITTNKYYRPDSQQGLFMLLWQGTGALAKGHNYCYVHF